MELNRLACDIFNLFGDSKILISLRGCDSEVCESVINMVSPTINGDGFYSINFIYTDNVIQVNILSLLADKTAVNTLYNIAYDDRSTFSDLKQYLKEFLSKYDPKINVIYGVNRQGNILHSQTGI